MSFNRCEHGVYQPNNIGGPNPACSVCTLQDPITEAEKANHRPPIKPVCPECGSGAPDFKYEDQYNWSCSKCGSYY